MTWRATWLVAALAATLTTAPAAATTTTAAADAVALVLTGNGSGSAFAIGHGRYITARHVVDGHDWVRLTTDRDAPTVPAQVLAMDDLDDVAVLHVPPSARPSLPAAPVPLGEAPVIDQSVTAVGHPGGGPRTSRPGRVVAAGFDRIEVAVTVDPGMSGGPLLDAAGTVVGIVIARSGPHGIVVPAPRMAAALAAADQVTPAAPAGTTIPNAWQAVLAAIGLGVAATARLRRHGLRRPTEPGRPLPVRPTDPDAVLIDLGPIRHITPTSTTSSPRK